jgi:hypothetical protein
MGTNDADNPLSKLPPALVDALDPEQRAALYAAINPVTWRRFPINIRLTFPLFTRRYFVTMVGGEERRTGERWRRDRALHPIRTFGNLLFILGIGGAFYLAAVLGIMLLSALIEF